MSLPFNKCKNNENPLLNLKYYNTLTALVFIMENNRKYQGGQDHLDEGCAQHPAASLVIPLVLHRLSEACQGRPSVINVSYTFYLSFKIVYCLHDLFN